VAKFSSERRPKGVNIEVLHKEIDLIQGCINRLSQNSFLLKGWYVSIIVVLLAVSSQVAIGNALLVVICVLATLLFWILDGYYLRLEKLYRELYKWVIRERQSGSTEYLYDLDTERFKGSVKSVPVLMRSKSLVCFYGISVGILVLFFAGRFAGWF
jgi:hypothetical protein